MKKIFLGLGLIMLFLVSGCGKYTEKDLVDDLSKKIDKLNGYYLEGIMEIYNGEDKYEYEVKVSYEKDDYYKVSLKNISNNHEQIILKNDDGVYVLTPSLNKTFKFQSEWPYNNSQVYLFQSIINDIKTDEDKTFEEHDNYYVFKTSVNYPNNRNLVEQLVYIDKDLNFKEVHVMDSNNSPQIKMKFNSIDMKATFKDDYFALDKTMEEAAAYSDITKEVVSLDEIIYPMYLPENTYLDTKDVIEKDEGERVILTFDGDAPFMLVEETVTYSEEMEIIPTYGDPELLVSTVGAVSDNSISWHSDGIDYYIVSDVLSKEQMVDIARSISLLPVIK